VTNPLTLDTIINGLADNDEMWVLQDLRSKRYLIIPDPRYPGRRPIRFYMKEQDAQAVLDRVLDVNKELQDNDIVSVNVKLKPALRGIAADKNPEHADAFVVHSSNEVFEYLWNGK
jgi:hypothetical protein